MTGRVGTDWRPVGALVREVSLPVERVPVGLYPMKAEFLLELRVRSLCWLGLIEKAPPIPKMRWSETDLYRKTPLYDEALAFSF